MSCDGGVHPVPPLNSHVMWWRGSPCSPLNSHVMWWRGSPCSCVKWSIHHPHMFSAHFFHLVENRLINAIISAQITSHGAPCCALVAILIRLYLLYEVRFCCIWSRVYFIYLFLSLFSRPSIFLLSRDSQFLSSVHSYHKVNKHEILISPAVMETAKWIKSEIHK